MRNPRKTRIAALLTAGAMTLAVPAPALAQSQGNQVAQINTGNLVSARNNVSAEVNNLEALNDLNVEDVRVVNVDNVLNDNNVRALNNALNGNDVDVNVLRDAIDDNEVIKQALNGNNVEITDVVAVDVLSGGDVVAPRHRAETITGSGPRFSGSITAVARPVPARRRSPPCAATKSP